jgi:hypothetical protein
MVAARSQESQQTEFQGGTKTQGEYAKQSVEYKKA